MKSQEPQEKKFRQLSDEELEKVTGGARGLTGISEECKDPEYRCSHVQVCNYVCAKAG
ncbi:MAG: bacteriocin [Bacteroidales bacterium]|nr:bacteriocin [Bacteroidales bacterium]